MCALKCLLIDVRLIEEDELLCLKATSFNNECRNLSEIGCLGSQRQPLASDVVAHQNPLDCGF